MHAIYVRVLVQLFHTGMEFWGRGETPPEDNKTIAAWIAARDSSAVSEATDIVMQEAHS